MNQVTFDTSKFDKALHDYMVSSQRELGQIIAQKSMDVCFTALKLTQRADADKIRRQLANAVVSKVSRSRITKRLRTTKQVAIVDDDKSLAARIIIARAAKAGKSPGTLEEIKKKALALIGARVRSRGFVASGWIAAISKIGYVLGRSFRFSAGGTKQYGTQKGDAIVRILGWKPVVTFINRAMQSKGARPYMKQIGEAGLQAGFDAVAVDMAEHTAQRLQKVADKYNAK